MMLKTIFSVLILFGLIGFGTNVSAHANGVSLEQTKDGYTIDIGYTSAAPAEGESLVMDFRLRKDTADVPFSDVWVKIETENNAVVFASGIHNSEFGGPRMSYVFPKAGKYNVSVRYENGADSIVEDSFPITVVPSTSGGIMLFGINVLPYLYPLAGFAAGVLSVLLIEMLIARRRKV